MTMPIQFAFNNPKRVRSKKRSASKKGVAKRKKRSKLKIVRHPARRKASKAGSAGHKSKISRGKFVAKKRRHSKRRSSIKRKRNPMLYTKAREGHKRGYRNIEPDIVSKKTIQSLTKVAAEAQKKYQEAPEASKTKTTWRKKYAAAVSALKKASGDRSSGIKTALTYRKEGYKITHISGKKKKSKKAGKKKSKGGSVAKRKKSRKKAKSTKRRTKAQRAATKKMLAANKARRAGKPTKKKSRKKSRKSTRRTKRRSAKRSAAKRTKVKSVRRRKHAHTHTFKIKQKRGRARLTGTIKYRLNPFGGSMDKQVQDWTGHSLKEISGLAAGGAVYGALNSLVNKYAKPVADITNSVPVVGSSILPILLGALIHKYGNKVPFAKELGEGIVGASVVGLGVSLSSVIPGLAMAGIDYTPNMSGVRYTPGLSGVNYTPNMGIMPQLAGRADFGRSADYGGGAGYTEQHNYSNADFGRDDDDCGSDEEYIGLGNSHESQMG